MTAMPSKLIAMSTTPWYRCFLTKSNRPSSDCRSRASEVRSDGCILHISFIQWVIDCKGDPCLDEATEDGISFALLFSSDVAVGDVEDERRSWVASADPKKRLWGITVAPSIPTAENDHEFQRKSDRRAGCIRDLQVYRAPLSKIFLEGTKPSKATAHSMLSLLIIIAMHTRTART